MKQPDVSEKQEIQVEQDTLGDRVVYENYRMRYLQEEIDREESYRRGIERERKEHQDKFLLIGTVVGCMLVAACIIWFMTEGFDLSDPTNELRAITVLITLPIFIFLVIGIIVYGRKTAQHGKQIKGTEDPRLRGGYKTYDEMWQISQGRMQYLEEELTQSTLTQEANKSLLTERRKQVQATEVIGMEELQQVIEEKKNQELSNSSPVYEIQEGEQVIEMEELYRTAKKEKKLNVTDKREE